MRARAHRTAATRLPLCRGTVWRRNLPQGSALPRRATLRVARTTLRHGARHALPAECCTHLRPMRRLASYTVRVGLVVAWFLAASPIRRSVSVNATQLGVMRLPWSLAVRRRSAWARQTTSVRCAGGARLLRSQCPGPRGCRLVPMISTLPFL